jgi:ribulose-phosphate 3-epimerase
MPLSVHLMLTRPDQYLHKFVDAGADSLLIHIEAECDVPEALERIRELGARPGITLNPATPAEMVFPVIRNVEEILCMTVHPGYGGQKFMPEVCPKIRALRDKAKTMDKNLDILVDGGINPETAAMCAEHGANLFIAGTSLYEAQDMAAETALLKEKATRAFVL